MRFGSVCSGIEAASVAWRPLGWEAQFFSEVAPFPSAVLAHHYPSVPNLGDINNFKDWNNATVDVLVGGTPCQSFSSSGLRAGLDDPRGNLMLTFLAMVRQFCPEWLIWENVSGVLSTNQGRDFGTFIGGLGQLGYGFAWRVIDAKHFGVPQRRRRLFVVGHRGNWQPAATVLFEREGLRGIHQKGEAFREANPEALVRCDDIDGGALHCLTCNAPYDICDCIRHERLCLECGEWTSGIHYAPEYGCQFCGAPRSWFPPLVGTLTDGAHQGGGLNGQDVYSGRIIVHGGRPRRLTPTECARLQGFPDDYLDIAFNGAPARDGVKYRAIANSMPVPVMRWIGERVDLVNKILKTESLEHE